MRRFWNAAIWTAALSLSTTFWAVPPLQAAAITPVTPQTYDCQARITRPEPVPPIRPGAHDVWQCAVPHNTPHSTGLIWFRDSLEYCRAATTAYGDAMRAAYHAALRYGPGGWIVLMDADETVLDNSLYQRERESCGAGFTEPTWESWIRAGAARDIPGAAAFTQSVHALGGFVGIVTNRDSADDKVTRRNLKAAGIHFDFETGKAKGAPSDKVARWKAAVAAIAKQSGGMPRPVIWVGDQVTDFPILDADGAIVRAMSQKDAGDGIGDRFFIIPNPVYGGWSSNPAN